MLGSIELLFCNKFHLAQESHDYPLAQTFLGV